MATRAHPLRALGSRNFRLFFGGQLISVIGTWMQQIAVSWLVYQLTHSAVMLGLVAFAARVPTFALTPFAGILADRFNRHRLVIATQALAMGQALVLAALTLSGRIQLWEVIALSLTLGVVNSFDIPIRQSFVPHMVERTEDVPNAIALNSILVNSARLVGPVLAGVLIATVGEGICFLLNGLSYLAVLWALVAMRMPVRDAGQVHAPPFTELREGFRYAFGSPAIRAILTLLAIVSLMGQPYATLLPIYATTILHGGPATLGYLVAANGAGAVLGALYLVSRQDARGLGRVLPIAALCFGGGLVAFSFSRVLWLSLACLVVAGVGMMLNNAASNTVLQTIVEDRMRGRMMSLFTMSIMGMIPFGSLLGGALAYRLGAPEATMLTGLVCALGGVYFAWQLPSVAEALARGAP